MEIYSLKLNHISNPVGFMYNRLVFSWKVKDSKGTKQEWARLLISSDKKMQGILYDSGEKKDLESIGTKVKLNLSPRTRYFWTVTVRDNAGETVTSDIQYFETAKLDEEWQAKWITAKEAERLPSLEKQFSVSEGKTLSAARLYICGLGVYDCDIDGERVGDEYLTPYYNSYNDWVQYQTFDITDMLSNTSTLTVRLAPGWYDGRISYDRVGSGKIDRYGDGLKLIAEIILTYQDGTEDIISTDESWIVKRTNLTLSDIYDGEIRDDTLPDLPPESAVYCAPPQGKLTERLSIPVKALHFIDPVEIIRTPAGETVFDLGQEITGVFSFRVNEPYGTKIHIQTGEILQHGNFYRENLRSAKSEYWYTSAGKETVIVPEFTFYGYRYVKVEGLTSVPEKSDLQGISLYSDMERVGYISTDNKKLNRLFENVLWSMRDNFLDTPTDCPQRDERLGWTGDAQAFAPTATYLYDTYAFYNKYLYDMRMCQKRAGGAFTHIVPVYNEYLCACGWSDAGCIIPWRMYIVTGDESILIEQYDAMKTWVDYVTDLEKDNHAWRRHYHYGDWLALDAFTFEYSYVSRSFTDNGFLASVYYAMSAKIVADSARILGKENDYLEYSALSRRILDETEHDYYSSQGRCFIKTQTADVFSMLMKLGDTEYAREHIKKLFSLYNGKHATGFLGTIYLCDVLTDNGMADIAYSLLLNEEFPGWLYEVNLGATTTWERWNSLLPDGTFDSRHDMNSLNHYAYGCVLEWVFSRVAGIRVTEDDPGMRNITLAPIVGDGINDVTATYDSPAGVYKSHWSKNSDELTLNFTVPFGCTAKICLPDAPDDIYTTQNPMFSSVENNVCVVSSGDYTVTYIPVKK